MSVPRGLAPFLVLATLGAAALAPATEPAHVHVHEAVAAAPLPGGSLYQLGATLEPAGAARLALEALRGEPVVVTMFYSRCTSVCPMLTLQMQHLAAGLGEPERARVRFLMVSLDAAFDTPERLAAFADEHHLPRPPFMVAHASAEDVRAVAAALGIRYRQLPDGSFSHASLITLLDRDGVPRARSALLAGDDPAFAAELAAAVR